MAGAGADPRRCRTHPLYLSRRALRRTRLGSPRPEGDRDFSELHLSAERDNYGVKYAYSGDYIGTGEVSHYLRAHMGTKLFEQWRLRLHYGVTRSKAIDDGQNQVGHYGASVTRGPFELLVSNMSDNQDARQSDNLRAVFSWRKDFTLTGVGL